MVSTNVSNFLAMSTSTTHNFLFLLTPLCQRASVSASMVIARRPFQDTPPSAAADLRQRLRQQLSPALDMGAGPAFDLDYGRDPMAASDDVILNMGLSPIAPSSEGRHLTGVNRSHQHQVGFEGDLQDMRGAAHAIVQGRRGDDQEQQQADRLSQGQLLAVEATPVVRRQSYVRYLFDDKSSPASSTTASTAASAATITAAVARDSRNSEEVSTPGPFGLADTSVLSAAEVLRQLQYTRQQEQVQTRNLELQSMTPKYEQRQQDHKMRKIQSDTELEKQRLEELLRRREELHKAEIEEKNKEIERLKNEVTTGKLHLSLASVPRPGPPHGSMSVGAEVPLDSLSGGGRGHVGHAGSGLAPSITAMGGGSGVSRARSFSSAVVLDEFDLAAGGSQVSSGGGIGVGDRASVASVRRRSTREVVQEMMSMGGNSEDEFAALRGLELPPTCYQKTVKLTTQIEYTQYFPLELSHKDYMRRLFDIVVFGIKERVLQMWHSGKLVYKHQYADSQDPTTSPASRTASSGGGSGRTRLSPHMTKADRQRLGAGGSTTAMSQPKYPSQTFPSNLTTVHNSPATAFTHFTQTSASARLEASRGNGGGGPGFASSSSEVKASSMHLSGRLSVSPPKVARDGYVPSPMLQAIIDSPKKYGSKIEIEGLPLHTDLAGLLEMILVSCCG